MTYEFSLVIFTVLGQLAAGLSLLIWLAGPQTNERLAWLFVLVAGLLGIAGGITHLHDAASVPYMILGLPHSWLSLETLAGAVFGLLVLLRVLNVLKAGQNFLPGIFGVIFVLVTSQVYFRNSLVPLWSNWGVILAFAAAMFAMGGAASLVFNQEPGGRKIALAAFIIGAVFAGVGPVFWLGALDNLDAQLIRRFCQAAICLGLTQMVALAVGGALLAVSPKRIPACIALILALAGIAAGRALFYAANIKLGI